MNYEEFKEQLIFENAKSDFENWINKKFPKGWFGYNPVYIISHPWKAVEYCAREIKWAEQRVFRGWDDRAWWGMDWYLSRLIPDLVKRIRDHGIGTPTRMWEGMIPINKDWNQYSDEDNKVAEEKWKNILTQIIDGFEASARINEESLWENDPEYAELDAKFEKGFELFREYYFNLWD